MAAEIDIYEFLLRPGNLASALRMIGHLKQLEQSHQDELSEEDARIQTLLQQPDHREMVCRLDRSVERLKARALRDFWAMSTLAVGNRLRESPLSKDWMLLQTDLSHFRHSSVTFLRMRQKAFGDLKLPVIEIICNQFHNSISLGVWFSNQANSKNESYLVKSILPKMKPDGFTMAGGGAYPYKELFGLTTPEFMEKMARDPVDEVQKFADAFWDFFVKYAPRVAMWNLEIQESQNISTS